MLKLPIILTVKLPLNFRLKKKTGNSRNICNRNKILDNNYQTYLATKALKFHVQSSLSSLLLSPSRNIMCGAHIKLGESLELADAACILEVSLILLCLSVSHSNWNLLVFVYVNSYRHRVRRLVPMSSKRIC